MSLEMRPPSTGRVQVHWYTKAALVTNDDCLVNAMGDATSKFYKTPYFFPGYTPVNDAYVLRDHSRWQPQLVFDGKGFEFQQTFDGSILGNSTSLVVNMTSYIAAPPAVYGRSNSEIWGVMKAQVDDVLNKSADLDDYQKMNSEYFNNADRYFLDTNLKMGQQKGFLCNVSKWSSVQALVHVAHYEAFQVAFANKVFYCIYLNSDKCMTYVIHRLNTTLFVLTPSSPSTIRILPSERMAAEVKALSMTSRVPSGEPTCIRWLLNPSTSQEEHASALLSPLLTLRSLVLTRQAYPLST